MKRMKSYWDQMHPELVFFTDKNLRDVATRIERNKTVMATGYSKTQVNNTQSENNVIIINDNSTVNIAIDTLNNNDVNSMERNNDTSDVIKSSDQYKSLQECFITNYNIFKEKPLDERLITTNINTKIDKTLYTTIDLIIKEHLESLEQVDYWVLNVSVYTAAYTI